MTVTYDLSAADVHRFMRYHAWTAPYLRRGLVLFVVTLTLILAAINYLRWPERPIVAIMSLVTTPLIFLVIGVIVMPAFLWVAGRSLLREGNRGVLGRHHVALEGDGVRETTEYGEQFARWTAVHRVEKNQDHILIYITPAMAHVIPKNAFPSEPEAVAFYEAAHRRWDDALHPDG